ncbi:MAG: ribosome biogenesis GTP-binding protein YihA/YsxC [Hyphomicrobiales bacterium]|nr:ribosome biogenesis GTP-binding protein YihA/YsxC [Hyphomicrobiales bacterium]MDE2115467.1 YihA family ribosome biogenesis GTP-binding protein [Hyphomicrobiales bacterium]
MSEPPDWHTALQPFFEPGRKLFALPCDFIWAAAKIDGLPPMGPPEIAFAGRSNVGKSSLLNALTNRKTLARTSNTPGRTQQLNFFALGEEPVQLRLVDMPGYGYAKVSQSKVDEWTRLMQAFLRGRANLARVFVLVDGRHGLKAVDHEMMGDLDAAAMPYQVVLTKRDEVRAADVNKMLEGVGEGLRKHSAANPNVLFTSSASFEGIDMLRAAVAQLLSERGFR